MIAIQEELDWLVYELYGLLPESATKHLPLEKIPPLSLGHRPCDIVLAREAASGRLETAWFERTGADSTTSVPGDYPLPYRKILEQRLSLIDSMKEIALIEQPEYKRRWSQPDWKRETETSLQSFLLNRAETALRDWPGRQVKAVSVRELARTVETDARSLAAAEVLTGKRDFDLIKLLSKLIESDSVPNNPHHRYKPSGLTKRAAWERTWALQRLEDAGEQVGEIPVPPKYKSTDFRRTGYWKLRGKLDVPKERFVAYEELPGARGEACYGWAGWDARQRAQALTALDEDLADEEAQLEDRCGVLQGLWSLLPDVERNHANAAGEYRAIAESACGQGSCPCPILEKWREKHLATKKPRRKKAAARKRKT